MKSARECNDRFEDLAAFVMGELEPAAARELQQHLAVCSSCRKVCDSLMDEEKEIQSGFATLARSLGEFEHTMLDRLQEGQCQADICVGQSQNNFFERVKNMITTHKRLSVAAAVTSTALAAGLIFHIFMFSSSTVAYALEQTVQANNRITSYHAKLTTPINGMSEIWVQLKSDGTPLRARIDYAKKDEGDEVVILSEGKAEMWGRVGDKKGQVVVPEKNALDRVVEMQKVCDPKLAFEELQTRKKDGKIEIETKEPAKEGGYLTLTVTPKDVSDQREVYEVNPNTKLAERVTYFHRQNDQWKQVKLIEYFDYNKEIDPKVFNLEMPKDVITIDQIKRKPGLVKGDLTDDQIATKVAREFFEALIAEDYNKAGLLLEGTSADKMKEMFGGFGRFLRIVEMAKPGPATNPVMQALAVPVMVEIEMKEQKRTLPVSASVPLTDTDTATKTVREFYEALVAEDFEKAKRIFKETGLVDKGMSAEEMKDLKAAFKKQNIKVKRVVEIGTPVPHPENGTMEVLVKIEVEIKGGKIIQPFSPCIRPVRGQPDRWGICGGI
jgi:hypothetical protein